MTHFPAEMKLLRAAVRQHITAVAPDDSVPTLLASVNWQHVLWLGRQHGALISLMDMLQAPQFSSLCPPEILGQLTVFREVHQLRALARASEVCRLQDAFDHHEIPAVLIDPWMFAVSTHGRYDLVEIGTALPYAVSSSDRSRAEAMLIAAGHPVDSTVHKLVTLGRSPVLFNKGIAAHPSADRLLAQSVAVNLGGRKLASLSPIHWLLARIWKQPPAEDTPLWYFREVVGIARSLSEANWRDVPPEAAHFGIDTAVVEAVTNSHQALGLPLSTATREALASLQNQKRSPKKASSKPLLSTVPFLPTPALVMDRMLKLAAPEATDIVYDLGCGDGRIVIKAAMDFGSRGVGVDLNPALIAEANARASAQGISDRVSFVCGDVFETDLSEATVLCLYLLPSFFGRILERLGRDGKPGVRIVSHDYIFPDWPPEKTEIIRSGPLKLSQIYLWRLP